LATRILGFCSGIFSFIDFGKSMAISQQSQFRRPNGNISIGSLADVVGANVSSSYPNESSMMRQVLFKIRKKKFWNMRKEHKQKKREAKVL
jgi:hypothetical protein